MSSDPHRDGDADRRLPRVLPSERQRLFLALFEAADRPMSTTEVSTLVDQTLGATAHHVRALVRNEYLEKTGERRVRGALQTFWTASEDGRKALRAPRIDTLVQLGAVELTLPEPGIRPEPLPELDEVAVDEIEEIIARVRPQLIESMRRCAERARRGERRE